MNRRYDHIVVGGGSAGCVVAARLAREAGARVLLLEAGPAAEQNPEVFAADGYKYAFINDALMWSRFSAPQPGCGGRRLWLGTGTGMGGSGSVNGMVYTRGCAEDFASWPEGWRWNDLVPAFEAVEATLRPRPRPATEFTTAALSACEQTGFRVTDQINGGDMNGVMGYEPMNYEGESRRSSYVAFIADEPPAELAIETGARAERIVLDGGRAVGVRYTRGGETQTALCDGDVVVTAGALETPRLLMLSGIGPAEHLREHGLPVVLDAPAVGENLHDHPNATLFSLGRRQVDCLYPQLYGFRRVNPTLPLPPAQPDTCFVIYPAPSSFHQAVMRMLPTIALPPALHDRAAIRRAFRGLIDAGLSTSLARRTIARLYGVVVILGKPQSRGSVRLASSNPAAAAVVDPAYFADEAGTDMDTMSRAVGIARDIADAEPLAGWGNREVIPGRRKRGDDAVRRWIAGNAMTTYHFAGTCAMGVEPDRPVDPQLRLRGVEGLRIADASVMPVAPVSALNAPSMAIGYRAASLIMNDARVVATAASARG